jgi:hypothetical protein
MSQGPFNTLVRVSATQIIREYIRSEAKDRLAAFRRGRVQRAALLSFVLIMSLLASCSKVEHGQVCGGHPADLAGLSRIIVFGEVHGTEEAPSFVASSVCELAKRHAVLVGIEHPSSEQETLNQFMAANSPGAGRAILAASGYWIRDGQDGKTSEAMLEMLDRLRDLRSDGADINVVAVGPAGSDVAGEIRKNINALAASSDARIVVLLGNAHTRKAGATGLDGQSAAMFNEPYKAIAFAHTGGSTWACAPTCEVQTLGKSKPQTEAVGELFLDTALTRFDGSVNLGAVHASPPAMLVPAP